jgi:small-conductance mechanosensitive channel
MKYTFAFCYKIVLATLIAVIGYFILGRLVKRLGQSIEKKVPFEVVGILRYFLLYGFYLLLIIVVLQTAGVNLSAVLTAAGIIGIAIGFAAQTSLSNIISGIMLLIEQSFKIGDLINCEGLEGHVETVGLLSITLRTVDNRLIRIPNERLMKDNVINVTTLGQRMLSFIVTTDNKEDIEKIWQLLDKIVNELPYRKQDKPVTIIFLGSSLQSIFNTPSLVQTIHFKVQFWVDVPNITAAKSAFAKACLRVGQEQRPPLLLATREE